MSITVCDILVGRISAGESRLLSGKSEKLSERQVIRKTFGRTLIMERQRGAYCGRKKALNSEQLADLKSRVAAGQPKTQVARDFGICREMLYKYHIIIRQYACLILLINNGKSLYYYQYF